MRLLRPEELADDWDPTTDPRLTIWEAVHHLVHALDTGGETAAAHLVRQLGGVAETARELAYRLYTVCERKKRPAEALSYNSLVQSWPEIVRLARQEVKRQAEWAVQRWRNLIELQKLHSERRPDAMASKETPPLHLPSLSIQGIPGNQGPFHFAIGPCNTTGWQE